MTSEIDDKVRALIEGADDVVAGGTLDLNEAGLTQRDALLTVCDEAAVWRSTDGDAFVSVPVDQHVEHHEVRSRSFRNWMLHRLAQRFMLGGRPASASDNAVRDARNMVEARAMVEGATHPLALRIAEHDGAIFIDLGFADWSVVRVTSSGWSMAPRAPRPILRGKRSGPFAIPVAPGSFDPLRRLLEHLDDDTFVLFIGWCLGALLPSGPYPILVLGGEQGAGKSTMARLAQKLTDPVHGDLLQPPGNDRDLIAAAKANRVLAFDNLSGVSAELTDSLCRLSTGSEIGGRALFSDHDTASFSACRPLIINGIPDLAARGDLADRAIVLRLPFLPKRVTERDWRAAVESILPAAFGALLDALSCGLGALDTTPTPDLRMSDFARFVVAAEPKLPWAPGAFVAAYRRSRLGANAVLADGDVVASAVRTWMTQRSHWDGLMSELFAELTLQADTPRPADWPGNARWFGDRLRRATPTLRALGISITERRIGSGQSVTLERIAPLASPAASTGAARRASDGANGADVATEPASTALATASRHPNGWGARL